MAVSHVLFEHAVGFALFTVKEFEEVGLMQPQVEESVLDLGKFNSVVQLLAFQPFKSQANSLDGINSISEGVLNAELRDFLEMNIPKSKKKKKVILGVGDPKIGGAINEELQVPCLHTGVAVEIMRGIRLHFSKLIKGLDAKVSDTAQLGLGHSYSRSKVKFNVNKVDNMIIQSVALLEQLDKDINTFSMRIREWYSYHFPELFSIVSENYMFAKVIKCIKDRKDLTNDSVEKLEEIVMDTSKATAIIDAAKSSMGMDIAEMDLMNILVFADKVIRLADYRKQLHVYFTGRMNDIAPNLSALIGENVGAKLISHAGSLTNLAKFPASTVQILGAEKALFRALKTRGATPKYGLIFHSAFISKAVAKNKGRISRYLANKCSIASRIDCFNDMPTKVFGEFMKKQVEDRLKFLESGDIPKKNNEVMQEAVAEFEIEKASQIKKKKKKDKKRKTETVEEEEEPTPKKKKDKKKKRVEEEEEEDDEEEPTPKKKKDKKKKQVEEEEEEEPTPKRKKDKKKKQEEDQEEEEVVKKKKKKKVQEEEEETPVKKSKKDKKKAQENGQDESIVKKKKKRKHSES